MKPAGVSKNAANPMIDVFRAIWQWALEHNMMSAAVLFALSFAIRLILSFLNGPVLTAIFPDELRYFHIAKSIAEYGQVLVRNVPVSFQKILYPFFISPAFLFTSDQLLQTGIIRVLNCLIMSSAIFPVSMLAAKMTSNKAVALISKLVVCTLPDMAFTATIMSEVLYMPMVAWVFYFGYSAMAESKRNQRLAFYGAFGLAVYLTYLTKEVAAGFLIAAVLALVIDGVRDRRSLNQNALATLILLSVFFAAHFIFKAAFFQGYGNSYGVSSGYDQITLAEISSAYDWFYLIYSAGLLFLAAIMSFYALPVFFSLYGYASMDNGNRKLFSFSLFSLAIMIGAYAYTVLIREELGSFIPRLSLRYFAPIVIPFLIQCFDFLLRDGTGSYSAGQSGKLDKNRRRGYAGGRIDNKNEDHVKNNVFNRIIIVFCTLIIVLMPSGPESDVSIDHFTLKSTLPLQGLHFYLAPGEMYRGTGEVHFNALWILFKLLLLLLTVFGASSAIAGKRRRALVLLLIFMFSVNAYDNTLSYLGVRYEKLKSFTEEGFRSDMRADYTNYAVESFSAKGVNASYGFINALISLNKYVKELDGSVLVFIPENASSYIDTYLEPKLFHSNYNQLLDIADASPGYVDVSAQAISDADYIYVSDSWERGLTQFDYIIVMDNDNPFRNTETVHIQAPFVVLRNLDPQRLYMDISNYSRILPRQ